MTLPLQPFSSSPFPLSFFPSSVTPLPFRSCEWVCIIYIEFLLLLLALSPVHVLASHRSHCSCPLCLALLFPLPSPSFAPPFHAPRSLPLFTLSPRFLYAPCCACRSLLLVVFPCCLCSFAPFCARSSLPLVAFLSFLCSRTTPSHCPRDCSVVFASLLQCTLCLQQPRTQAQLAQAGRVFYWGFPSLSRT
jgi:hypothetical protein